MPDVVCHVSPDRDGRSSRERLWCCLRTARRRRCPRYRTREAVVVRSTPRAPARAWQAFGRPHLRGYAPIALQISSSPPHHGNCFDGRGEFTTGSVCHSQPSLYAGGCPRNGLGGRPLHLNDTRPRHTSTYQANCALSALDSRSARFAWGSTFGSRAARPCQEGPSWRFRRRTRSCPGPVAARPKALRASAESPLRGLGST